MVDTSHIERMGKELKCPICLSLLNSAVSLSCNHVFCNCCIDKSMKSASNCPVCKVPFRRREIHPAPHMDNLVSIYKSMKVASGVNIFVTQTAPSTRISGHESHPDDDKINDIQENSKICIRTLVPENQKRCKIKGSTRTAQADPTNSSFNPSKPSFPAKKRVHVPQCPPSDNLMRSEKVAHETAEITRYEPKSSFMPKDKLVSKEKGDPRFTPFFWLRDEEDAEETTEQTDGSQIMETPPDAPCFSDIKDSDEEVPSQMPPDRETCIAYSHVDFFDSEMFEWTQRACSPELRSSPVRMQAEDSMDWWGQEKKGSATPVVPAIMESKVQNGEVTISETDKAGISLPCSSSSFSTYEIVGKRTGMCRKRKTKKEVENRQSKRAKMSTNKACEAHKESEKRPVQYMQEEKFDKNGNVLNLTKKPCKRNKNVSFYANVTEPTGDISTSSSGTNPLIQIINRIVVDLPALSDQKRHKKESNLKKIGKISKKNISPLKKQIFNSKIKKLKAANESLTLNQCKARNSSKDKELNTENRSLTLNHCEVLISHSPRKISADAKAKEDSDKSKVLKECVGNHGRKKKSLKIVRFSEGNKYGDTMVDNLQYQNGDGKVAAKDTQSLGADQEKSISRGTSNSSGVDLLSGTNPNKIICAFCQSAEDSEASGVMVHYRKGKSIAGDDIREPTVIHSHKNCTEWAPNVFFEDDNAINLEAEMARSRKIKCGLCGMRGAALGCFHKSCRKSFHVSCAKMTPKFRWDYDNFVLLCPLHASCKLPCEAPGSQSNQKRTSSPKGDSHIQQPQVVNNDIKVLPWKSHKKDKNFFLCCSGLTDVEKDIVSQFERLSRVTVSKNWDLSVTHVVASTDENGACKRTLKFLMGVLEGKWIVNIEWVKACIKSTELVDEELYEIKVDSHGIRDGPNCGRSRLLYKKPKLFRGYKFYFVGEFVPSYKGYLHDLITAAGGTVLNRKPISEDQETFSSECLTSNTFIVYSLEQPEKCGASKRNSILNSRRLDAEALATSTRAVAVSNSWILNSIAGCKLQNLTE